MKVKSISFFKFIYSLFYKISNCGINKSDKNIDFQRIYFFNLVLIFAIGTIILNTIFDLFTRINQILIIDISIFLIFILILIINTLQWFNISKFLFFVVFILLSCSYNYYLPNVGTENYLFPIIFFATQIIKKKVYLILLVIFYIFMYAACKFNTVTHFLITKKADYT